MLKTWKESYPHISAIIKVTSAYIKETPTIFPFILNFINKVVNKNPMANRILPKMNQNAYKTIFLFAVFSE